MGHLAYNVQSMEGMLDQSICRRFTCWLPREDEVRGGGTLGFALVPRI